MCDKVHGQFQAQGTGFLLHGDDVQSWAAGYDSTRLLSIAQRRGGQLAQCQSRGRGVEHNAESWLSIARYLLHAGVR